jgi:hypothetical protein
MMPDSGKSENVVVQAWWTIKTFMDFLCASTSVVALWGFINALPAIISAVWMLLRIYESQTVQRWLRPKGTRHSDAKSIRLVKPEDADFNFDKELDDDADSRLR